MESRLPEEDEVTLVSTGDHGSNSRSNRNSSSGDNSAYGSPETRAESLLRPSYGSPETRAESLLRPRSRSRPSPETGSASRIEIGSGVGTKQDDNGNVGLSSPESPSFRESLRYFQQKIDTISNRQTLCTASASHVKPWEQVSIK